MRHGGSSTSHSQDDRLREAASGQDVHFGLQEKMEESLADVCTTHLSELVLGRHRETLVCFGMGLDEPHLR